MSVIDELSSLLNLPATADLSEKEKIISAMLENLGYDKDILKRGFSAQQIYSALTSTCQLSQTSLKTSSNDIIKEVYSHTEPGENPKFSSKYINCSQRVSSALYNKNILRLYKHQEDAIKLLNSGKNIVLTTETASGKSLVYLLPFQEEVIKDPNSTGLFIYPTKALSNDQMINLLSYNIATAEKYDGDTEPADKKRIRNNNPNAIFTNPDTIHHSMLRTCGQWNDFFKNLKFIVIDEIHMYKGYFGSNVSNILYRLLSAVKKAGGNPKIVCTSATINDAKIFAEELVHEKFVEISSSTSGKTTRDFLFLESGLNPNDNSFLISPRDILLNFVLNMANKGMQGIAFVDSRKKIDILEKYAKDSSLNFQVNPDAVVGYHAGLDYAQRVQIENGIKNKNISIVFSTSALEIGIDIGSLDYCVLFGIPPLNNQIWQRIGRAGRQSGKKVAVVLINRFSVRDNYFFENPSEFFKTKVLQEKPIIFPENEYLQELHQQCAFFEGMKKGETLKPAIWAKVKKSFDKSGAYLRIPIRKPWHEDYNLIDESTGAKIGEVEYERIFTDYHKNAIVLKNGMFYQCKSSIDYDTKTIPLFPIEEPKYFTQPVMEKYIKPVSNIHEAIYEIGKKKIFLGEGKVHIDLTITAVRKIFFDGTPHKLIKLNPPREKKIKSHSLWLSIKDEKFEVLHTLEHLIQRAVIELGYCDWSDIKGLSTTEFARYKAPAIFIYEDMKIGTGMAKVFYDNILEIIKKAKDIVTSCPCQDGCPQCIHSTNYCELYDGSLNKQYVIDFLNNLDFNKASKKNFTPRVSLTTDEFKKYGRDAFDIGDTYVDGWKVIDKTEDEYVIENSEGDVKAIDYEDTPL